MTYDEVTLYVEIATIQVRDDGRRYRVGNWQENTDYGVDEVGKLYRALVHDFGRCISSVYCDTPTQKAQRVGWVFLKRVNDLTLVETWVTVFDGPHDTVTTKHYHDFGKARR